MELILTLILCCIPLIILAWTLPEKWQLLPIVAMAIFYIGYYSPVSLLILIITTISSYFLLKKREKFSSAYTLAILQAISFFLFFKTGFKNESFTILGNSIPLGMSYYFFRQIHYTFETFKGKIPQHNFREYICYMFFLPTILIGPINLFQDFIRDSKRRRWDSQLFSLGLERILYGLAKIIILGNYLFSYVIKNYTEYLYLDHSWLPTYIDSLRFFANAYVQFAGYSDIAIGLSMLTGFRIIENFNYPFLATNISDFWQRWHISLSSWCREYVYLPVYSFSRKAYLGLFFTMLVIAFWHEISLRYFLWGLSHAIALNIWHRYNNSKLQGFLKKYLPFPKITGVLITLHFVAFSFILTRENTWSDIIAKYKILFGINILEQFFYV